MGLFDKLKNIITRKEVEVKKDETVKKYDEGLEKSRNEFVSKLSMLGIKYTKINDEYFDELENILIMADIGVNTVMDFMDRLRKRVKSENITDTKYLNEVIVDELFIIYVNNESITELLQMIMKTTNDTKNLLSNIKALRSETGKLEDNIISIDSNMEIFLKRHCVVNNNSKLYLDGKKVMLVAGDTFRAGAVEQLKIWADRTDTLFYGKENIDPAGVIFDGLTKAKEENADIVLIDTAGRLHNKKNLMEELKKINRIIDKEYPGAFRETLVVLDGTTGQNALAQAKQFMEVADITGIILTKMDGTAKGGIAVAIQSELGIPVKYIGVGETIDDLQKFDSEQFVDALFSTREE